MHIVLPDTFLAEFCIPHDSSLLFYAQTRTVNSLQPTPYIRVIGKFFRECESSGSKVPVSGLATSLPVFLRDDMYYDPSSLVTLKILDPNNNKKIFIDFFYITLMGQYSHACHVTSKSLDVAGKSKELETSPLEKIFEDLSKTQPKLDKMRTSPLSHLSRMLHSKPVSVPKHHRALEDPGSVRGTVDCPTKTETPAIKKLKKIKCRLNLIDVRKANITFHTSTHIITCSRFIVCEYNNLVLKPQQLYESVFNLMNEDELKHVNPLGAFITGFRFLEEVQLKCVNSLEDACCNNRMMMYQKLPLCIEKDQISLEIIKDHFVEACLVLRQLVSENSAWIKACVSLNERRGGIWVDFLNLWENGPCNLGVDLSHLFAPGCQYKEAAFWSQLLRDPGIAETVEKTGRACLVVDTALVAWLILPGGFAIKGRYSISVEDLQIISSRYG